MKVWHYEDYKVKYPNDWTLRHTNIKVKVTTSICMHVSTFFIENCVSLTYLIFDNELSHVTHKINTKTDINLPWIVNYLKRLKCAKIGAISVNFNEIISLERMNYCAFTNLVFKLLLQEHWSTCSLIKARIWMWEIYRNKNKELRE